jgi:hypothetical protein
MARLDFTFANGLLTVSGGGRTENFYASDFRAKTEGTKVTIHHFNQDDNNRYVQRDWSEYEYTDLTCQGVGYENAELFVTVFNALAGASIGFNTKYPETMFSQTIALDTSVDEQVVPLWCQLGHNAGYVTLTTPSTNTGNIYVGESDVNNTNYYLEPDKSITLEASDLSDIWVQSTTPGDVVMVIGFAKI